jgi:hypothetical protein
VANIVNIRQAEIDLCADGNVVRRGAADGALNPRRICSLLGKQFINRERPAMTIAGPSRRNEILVAHDEAILQHIHAVALRAARAGV